MNKILIIDDELLIRQSLFRVAEMQGFFVKTAGTAEEGLKIWRADQPDLVFLDLILPDGNGLSLMKNKPCPSRVVLMSAHSQYSEKAEKKGADLFIAKPFENIFQTFDQVISHFHTEKNEIQPAH